MRKSRKQLDSEMELQSATGPIPGDSEHIQPAGPAAGVDQGDDQQAATPLSDSLQQRLSLAVESLLFVAGEPITLAALLEVLRNFHPDLTGRQLRAVLERLRLQLREQGRGVRLAEVAGGFQLRTPSEAAPYLRKLVSRRPPRMTRATLETLAIVAYRQPVTRAEVEQIRGVDCGAVLRHLLDKRLVKIIGRKDEPGRPLLYGTTRTFLEFFSLKDLQSLPTLKDFAELSEEARQQLGLPGEEESSPQQSREENGFSPLDSAELAPPGDDEVVRELADVLAEVSRRDRQIRREILASEKEKQDSANGAQPPAGEQDGPQQQPAADAQPEAQDQIPVPPDSESGGGEGRQQ